MRRRRCTQGQEKRDSREMDRAEARHLNPLFCKSGNLVLEDQGAGTGGERRMTSNLEFFVLKKSIITNSWMYVYESVSIHWQHKRIQHSRFLSKE